MAALAEELSTRAIGEGTVIAAKGAAALALGQPGGAAALGIGAGLVAAGLAGTFGASALSGYISGTAGARETSRAETRAPTTSVGAGRTTREGPETTVVQYFFGGPVFGQPDDAARAVAAMNDRGRELEGL